ncbi:hypothetical protein HYALB_00013688 [Hymenoscyphus albidus]|uniref:Uncharacterized protein n=1 Tax=Hymenoscyphus albidus TaxID=595503 RepID=A0A9N9LTC4_9HELO|nr:hypothetical protein HYALB_00013688 [Hymenoscyphus albidus]
MASNQLFGELLSELPAALAQHEDTFQLPQMSILPHDNPVEMDYTLTTYGGQPHYLTFPSSSHNSQINQNPSGATLTFWFFPTEIREMIFSFALFPAHLAKHGMHHVTAYSKHPLLVALRGDTQLYSEAIEVFYKLNTVFYTIDYKDFCGPGELERVKKVRHLGVDLSFGDDDKDGDGKDADKKKVTRSFKQIISTSYSGTAAHANTHTSPNTYNFSSSAIAFHGYTPATESPATLQSPKKSTNRVNPFYLPPLPSKPSR